MRGKCVGKVTAAPGVWQEPEWKNNEWKLRSLPPPPWHSPPSPPLSGLFSFALASLVIFHLLLPPSMLLFYLTGPLFLFFSPPLFSSPCLLCLSFLLSHSLPFLTHLSFIDSLALSPPFFMSFWPRSHFPNWLSGSLIILRHPCCRLFYLSACRHPNPLISKYPSSAHTASQQPTAFLVYFSKEHTDGPYTSSRHSTEWHWGQRHSWGTLVDQNTTIHSDCIASV